VFTKYTVKFLVSRTVVDEEIADDVVCNKYTVRRENGRETRTDRRPAARSAGKTRASPQTTVASYLCGFPEVRTAGTGFRRCDWPETVRSRRDRSLGRIVVSDEPVMNDSSKRRGTVRDNIARKQWRRWKRTKKKIGCFKIASDDTYHRTGLRCILGAWYFRTLPAPVASIPARR